MSKQYNIYILLAVLLMTVCITAQPVIVGTNGYIRYEVGGTLSQVILTASHGGSLEPASIQDRASKGCFDSVNDECIWEHGCGQTSSKCKAKTSKDLNTDKLAQEIANAITTKIGSNHRPHVIINNLKRSKLDANRDLAEATFGDPISTTAWKEYHEFTDWAKENATIDGRRALYVDIHGQNQPENLTMIGLLLDDDDLAKNTIPNRLAQFSSIMQLHVESGENLESLVRGSNSVGGLLQTAGYDTVPSPTNKDPGSATFFRGGYSVRRHTGWIISGFQIEAHFRVRSPTSTRLMFADKVADAILHWINNYY